ncbi:cupredoxin family protein [Microvirga sp. HBU67558]|uniref:cupredoxin domain-containing protein n=1 Tax=Microvirga TaxID=186650 RepID=UPI001B359C65|nr:MULTISPECIES: cupredoxin family protein [unclassified Microvirga]MBQ0821894.1 cupredoxin family protein [Microvirga sp. HBU67558]
MKTCISTVMGAAAALTLATGLALAAPGEPGHTHKSFAAGEPGDPKKSVARTIEVTMKETDDAKMLFEPNKVEIKRGEQVKFVLKNHGQVDHEFMLDSIENNAKHKVQMQKNPDMEHDDPNGKRLAPMGSNEIVWRFTKAGTFEFACLIPGHYESGMHGTVVVK